MGCEKISDDDCKSQRGWGNFHIILGNLLIVLSVKSFEATGKDTFDTLGDFQKAGVVFSILAVIFGQLSLLYMGFERKASIVSLILLAMMYSVRPFTWLRGPQK